METITKKCNNCKKALSVEVFGDNGKGECFKTCDSCRDSARERKARDKFRRAVEVEQFFKKDVKTEVVKLIETHVDEWALMSRESLDLLSYEEREAIPINPWTVVSELNIFFICEKIIKYCGDDAECTTVMDTETIQVFMTDRGGDFVVKHGDTWAEIREGIHCC
jgi:hypothetical protein